MADSHAPAHNLGPASQGHTPTHDDAHHVSQHIKAYLLIGGLLLFLTGVTVWLSFIDFGSETRNIVIALIVATFKAGLVAAIFMHLKGEKSTIWRFLIFTAIFVTGLFALTFLHESDPIPGTVHPHKAEASPHYMAPAAPASAMPSAAAH